MDKKLEEDNVNYNKIGFYVLVFSIIASWIILAIGYTYGRVAIPDDISVAEYVAMEYQDYKMMAFIVLVGGASLAAFIWSASIFNNDEKNIVKNPTVANKTSLDDFNPADYIRVEEN